MKKKIIVIVVILLIVLSIGGFFGFYFWGLDAKSNNTSLVTFTILPGTSKTEVAKNLERAGLIRSEIALDLYLMIHQKNIQAGEYELSENMKPEEMIDKFYRGDIKIHSFSVTLLEGQRLSDYGEILGEKASFNATDFLDAVGDYEYIQELIESNKYWFLDDIVLNDEIYYPLEGYLYPDTYEFLETVTPKEVIEKILDHTLTKLEPFHDEILASGKSAHEILTLASIIEIEASKKEDRKSVSQVFYTRLASNDTLGSDVTTYYGVGKKMKDSLTRDDLYNQNPYNTRLQDGSMNGKLPIGPISNPSIESIEAALHPSDTNYYYFVANVCTGEIFFQTNSNDFLKKCEELRNICSEN